MIRSHHSLGEHHLSLDLNDESITWIFQGLDHSEAPVRDILEKHIEEVSDTINTNQTMKLESSSAAATLTMKLKSCPFSTTGQPGTLLRVLMFISLSPRLTTPMSFRFISTLDLVLLLPANSYNSTSGIRPTFQTPAWPPSAPNPSLPASSPTSRARSSRNQIAIF